MRIVGDVPIEPTHRASCHCGGVVLELDLPDGLVDARRCTCSMCRRKGAVMGAVATSGLRVVRGADLLRVYRFNTRVAEHFFCSRCGIYTHHRRRSKPDQFGFNVGCLEDIQPTEIPNVPVNDGVDHPADRDPSRANAIRPAAARMNAVSPRLPVGSIEAALRFYVDVLGFRVGWQWGTPPSHANVFRDAIALDLLRVPAGREGTAMIYVELVEVDALHAEIARGGVDVDPPADRDYGMRDFEIVDPDGNRIAFGEPLPRT